MRVMNELKAHLEATEAYQRFQVVELPPRLKTQKLSPLRAGELLLSIDVVQANFSLLATFDSEGALGASPDYGRLREGRDQLQQGPGNERRRSV